MIEAINLFKKFESGGSQTIALNNVSFSVKKGEFIAVTGRSGSGKSTLLYQLGLLDHPSEGKVVIDGVDVNELSSDDRTRFRLYYLGYVFQDYAILPSLSAIENVALPLLMQGIVPALANEKAKVALERVGLGARIHNLPSQLSGGEQQRVAIARAISHDPKIIFADEPTANLDTETSATVLKCFLDLHKEGQTIIMVTHEPEYAALADRIFKLSDGQISFDK